MRRKFRHEEGLERDGQTQIVQLSIRESKPLEAKQMRRDGGLTKEKYD